MAKPADTRAQLVAAARDVVLARIYRRYGYVDVDLGYLEDESDFRLRTIVRSFYGTDDLEAIQVPEGESLLVA